MSHPIYTVRPSVDLSSLKIQCDKLKQYQKRVGTALLYPFTDPRKKETSDSSLAPLLSLDPGYRGA
jgi:hypothetical protein